MCYLYVCLCLSQATQGGGHRTLLYGHAVLLRHSYSGMVSKTTARQQELPKLGKADSNQFQPLRGTAERSSLNAELKEKEKN